MNISRKIRKYTQKLNYTNNTNKIHVYKKKLEYYHNFAGHGGMYNQRGGNLFNSGIKIRKYTQKLNHTNNTNKIYVYRKKLEYYHSFVGHDIKYKRGGYVEKEKEKEKEKEIKKINNIQELKDVLVKYPELYDFLKSSKPPTSLIEHLLKLTNLTKEKKLLDDKEKIAKIEKAMKEPANAVGLYADQWENGLLSNGRSYFHIPINGISINKEQLKQLKDALPKNTLAQREELRLADNNIYYYLENNLSEIHELLRYIVLGPEDRLQRVLSQQVTPPPKSLKEVMEREETTELYEFLKLSKPPNKLTEENKTYYVRQWLRLCRQGRSYFHIPIDCFKILPEDKHNKQLKEALPENSILQRTFWVGDSGALYSYLDNNLSEIHQLLRYIVLGL